MDSLAGQQLLRKDEKVVSADTALEEKKIIAFYFSAHWCPPCRLFTPVLAEFYSVCWCSNKVINILVFVQDLVGAGEGVEVVFVSSDKSAEEMMGYMKECHGDWLAVQHGTVLAQDLKKKYEITGIPTLIVVTRYIIIILILSGSILSFLQGGRHYL